jgi:hypothetical protein
MNSIANRFGEIRSAVGLKYTTPSNTLAKEITTYLDIQHALEQKTWNSSHLTRVYFYREPRIPHFKNMSFGDIQGAYYDCADQTGVSLIVASADNISDLNAESFDSLKKRISEETKKQDNPKAPSIKKNIPFLTQLQNLGHFFGFIDSDQLIFTEQKNT